MILSFKFGGVPFFISVGRNRLVSFGTVDNSFVFRRVDEFVGLKGFKGELLVSFKRRVKLCRDLVGVRDYLVFEMEKLGYVFSRELSVVEYKVFMKELEKGG